MKIIKGWKMLSHDAATQNDISGQTVVVSKKDFSNDYHVRLFECGQTRKKRAKQSRLIMPQRLKLTLSRDWMQKHPNGDV